MNATAFVLYFLVLTVGSGRLWSQSNRNQGWSLASGNATLMSNGKEVLSSRDGYRFQSPTNLTLNQEIDYYLALGEFYLHRKDKVGVANILYDLRTKKGDYSFADAILTSLWKQVQGNETQAVQVLDTFIQKESNPYFKNLAKNMRTNLFQYGEDEKKSMIKMDCLKTKPYYSLCRVFRLQYYIEIPNGAAKEIHKNYVNIMRVSSPFFEDPILEWIPLLDLIDEDLPVKLAFLGLIREADYFQSMIMDSERASSGEVSENSLERQSFLKVLAGDYHSAEWSLLEYLKITKGKKSSLTNRIYLKLGVLAYLQKDYKKSVEYYLKLDIANWSTNVLHPILNEPVSITGAKDLIAVSIWKSQGADAAIRALQKIQDPVKLAEDDIWPKLRLAQIMADQNPELASRITDEIIYMAQGRSWRRLEYAATILQGYIQIYRKEFRKSSIELTKSRGILDADNFFFASEFIRNFGFVFAHTASGKRGPISGHIREGILDYQKNFPYEDLLLVRNYRLASFSTDQFWDYSLQHQREDSDGWGLLDSLYHNELIKKKENEKEKPYALSQLAYVDTQFKYLAGFQSPREAKFFDSSYVESRQLESNLLSKQEEENVQKGLESTKFPSIFVLPYKESVFMFFHNPKESKKNSLTWKEIKITRFDSLEVTESIKDFINLTKDSVTHQIYFNEAGYISLKTVKRYLSGRDVFLFDSMLPSAGNQKPLTAISWECPLNNNVRNIVNLKAVETGYFEGSRILKDKERLHLWDFVNQGKRDGSFMNLSWSCQKPSGITDEISMARLVRRIDYRTVPRAVVYSEKVLNRNFQDGFQIHASWIHFWFRSGVKLIYYKPKWAYSETLGAQIFTEPSFYREDGLIFTQSAL